LNKVVQILLKLAPVALLLAFSKRISLPGFQKLPLYDTLKFMIDGFQKGDINTRAAAVSFKFFLAIFPGIIFLFTLIPYMPVENFQNELLLQLQAFLPTEAYEMAKETIVDLMSNQHQGLLSFGFVFALYFTANGVNALLNAFNQSYFVDVKSSAMKQRFVSILLILILSVLVIVAVLLIIFQETGIKYLKEFDIITDGFILFAIKLADWLIVLSLLYFAVSFLYFLAPAERGKWRFFSAGSTFATLLIILTCLGFAWYVNNFGQFNKVYGSIGTVMVILIWLNLNATILILGFDLNASIKKLKANAGK
jgi:membrane protein